MGLANSIFDWRYNAFIRDGRVHHMTALELLRRIDDMDAGCIVLDPPERLGIGAGGDDIQITAIDEHTDALRPIANECARILRPGGITIILGGPRIVSAWEVVANWEGLSPQGEIVVLWKAHIDNRRAAWERPSLGSLVRWHAKPGRTQATRPLRVSSNIITVEEVADNLKRNLVQRPVPLFTYLISHLTNDDDLVVDPYCGSGSSLVAARIAGRRSVGSDTNSEQCCVATERIATALVNEEIESRQRVCWWLNGLEMEVS